MENAQVVRLASPENRVICARRGGRGLAYGARNVLPLGPCTASGTSDRPLGTFEGAYIQLLGWFRNHIDTYRDLRVLALSEASRKAGLRRGGR